MTPKEYLGQARWLDTQINDELGELYRLESLATKMTQTFRDMPATPNKNITEMEDNIIRIHMLEEEVNRKVDRLVDLKQEIKKTIADVAILQYRILLTKRYLGFKSWEDIAVEMRYSIDNVYKIHGKALKEIKVP